MKKRRAINLLLAVTMFMLSVVGQLALPTKVYAAEEPAITNDNLVTNGSFDTLPGNDGVWWPSQSNTSTLSLDSASSKDGASSLEFTHNGAGWSDWTWTTQTVNLQVNSYYTVSAWVSSTTEAAAKIVAMDYGGDSLEAALTNKDGEWHQVVIPNVKVTTNKITIGISTGGENGGTAHIDDVELVKSNFISNGSFETTPGSDDGWWPSAGTDGSWSVDTAVYRAGSQSLSFVHNAASWDNPSWTWTNQVVTLPENAYYTATAWVKSSSDATIKIVAMDYGGANLEAALSSADGEWHQIVIPDVKVTNKQFTLGISTSGINGAAASIDDVQLIKTGDIPSNLLVDSSFENDTTGLQPIWGPSGHAGVSTDAHTGSVSARFYHSVAEGWSYSWMGQSLSGLEPGVYQLKAWVKGTGVNTRCDMQIDGDYGGTHKQLDFTPTDTWTQITIPDISVTKDSIMVGFDTESDKDAELLIDDVEFYRSGDLDRSKMSVDDLSDLITYSKPDWQAYSDLNDYAGTESVSVVAGAYAQFTFRGTHIQWKGTKNSNFGKANVYIDGTLAASDIDCYASAKQYDQVLFDKTGLDGGLHTIKVEAAGTKNADSSGTGIAIDQFFGDFADIPLTVINNYVLNSSFEDNTTSWDVTGSADAVKLDSADPHLGGNDLIVSKDSAYDAEVSQTITGLTNGTYELTAWVKSSGGQTNSNMTVKVLDDNTHFADRKVDIATQENWKQITISNIYVTDGKCYVGFNSSGDAGTSLSIDDVVLTLIKGTEQKYIDQSKLSRSYAENGSFESGTDSWVEGYSSSGAYDEVSLDTTAPHSGSNNMVIKKNTDNFGVSESQYVHNLPAGKYLLTAWVKYTGDPDRQVTFNANPTGGTKQTYNIYPTTDWTQISIQNIDVQQKDCEIQFYISGNQNSVLSIDDVELRMIDAPSKLGLYQEDFTNTAGWNGDSNAKIEQKNADTITLARIQSTDANDTSMSGSVSYDIDAEPYLSLKLFKAMPGASWKLAVNDGTGDDIPLTPDFKTETGLFNFDLKGITGWSGTKTFTIKFIVSGGAGKFIDIDYIQSMQNLDVIVNQLGYLTNGSKQVVMQGTAETPFSVITEDGTSVYDGTMTPVGGDSFGTQYIRGDFSSFKTPGKYKIKVEDATSSEFTIGDGAYDAVYNANLEYFTLQRCGNTSLNWHGAPDHLDDGRLYINAQLTDQYHDTSGGWHDAGDTRKWVGCIDFALLALTDAWQEMNPADFNVRAELRYGNEYFFKMQQITAISEDGKITGKGYWNDTAGDSPSGVPLWTDNIPQNGDERSINPTLLGVFEHYNMVAAEAKIARLFKDIDPAYSQKCLQSSVDAYTFCVTLEKRLPETSQQLGAAIDACAELYKTTRDIKYKDQAAVFAEQLLALQQKTPVNDTEKIYGFFHNSESDLGATNSATENWLLWSLSDLIEMFPADQNYKDALNSYFYNFMKPLSERNAFGLVPYGLYYGKDPGGAQQIGASQYYMRYFMNSVTPTADNTIESDWWVGQNGALLATGAGFARAANLLHDAAMLKVAQDQYNWVLGYNPYNRSSVTGFGYNNIPSYYVNINQTPIPGGVVNGIGSPSNNDSPDPVDGIDYYQTHEYWTPQNYQMIALETELMKANGNEPASMPAADPNEVDSFTDTYNWSTHNTYMDNLTDSGYVDRITSTSGTDAYIERNDIKLKMDTLAGLSIKVDEVSSGASWRLIVNDGGSDIDLSPVESGSGVFTYDLKAVTGWSGTKTFTMKIEVLGGAGKSVQVDSIKKLTEAAPPGGGNTPPPTPAPTPITVTGNTVSADVTAIVDGATGIASLSVSASAVTDLIDQAKAIEASGKNTVVELNVKSTANANAVNVMLPRGAVNQLADDTNAALKLNTAIGTVTFDAKAVSTISSSASSGDIIISIKNVDNAVLVGDAQKKVGDRPVYNFSVQAGSTAISNFNGGKVQVSIPYTLKAGEKPNAIVVYYIDSTGKLKTVRGKYNPATGMVDFTTTHFSEYAIGYNEVKFNDVASNAWYGDAVGFMAARGIANGIGSGKFAPESNTTRADFLIMVMNAYGIEVDTTITVNFADAGNKYYTQYLAAAKQLGLVSGVGNNKFTPEATISRQDMLVILYNALVKIGELPTGTSGKILSSFTDSGTISGYADTAMKLFVETGVISGEGSNLIPKAMSTRAQVAQVLYNLLSK